MAKHLSIDIRLDEDVRETAGILNKLSAAFTAGFAPETITPYPLKDLKGNTVGYIYIYMRPDHSAPGVNAHDPQ